MHFFQIQYIYEYMRKKKHDNTVQQNKKKKNKKVAMEQLITITKSKNERRTGN